MTEPKPCPVPNCGKPPKVLETGYGGRIYVECACCEQAGPRRQSPEEAIAAWNSMYFVEPGHVVEVERASWDACLPYFWTHTESRKELLSEGPILIKAKEPTK